MCIHKLATSILNLTLDILLTHISKKVLQREKSSNSIHNIPSSTIYGNRLIDHVSVDLVSQARLSLDPHVRVWPARLV